MKIALVHDWLTGMRGGEKVLEIFCELFPTADIFTLLHKPGSVSPQIESHKIFTSFIQKMPSVEKRYRYYLPLMPKAIESFDLSEYDVVISSSHCVAKGCKPRSGAFHICYCFTPMRYIWDQYKNYFGAGSSLIVRSSMRIARSYLQRWDTHSSKRVAEFVAISKFVQDRIRNFYNRESSVIYPPVDTDFYTSENPPQSPFNKGEIKGGFYLIVSALAPYKRIDIAVESFNRCGLPLKIIGSGQSEKQLKVLAKKNIEFLGWLSDEQLLYYYRNCKALIFPGVEDFGIVPLEAMACGKPVIAYRKGGATETILENETGVFFESQDAESLAKALKRFEQMKWNSSKIRQQALKFSKREFIKNIVNFLKEKIPQIDPPTNSRVE